MASLRSEKTIVLALLIQLFVASFSSFLVVGLVSLSDPGSVEGYTADVAVTGEATDDLLRAAGTESGIDAVPYPNRRSATLAFEEGRVDAVLDTAVRDGRVHVTAVAPDESVRSTVVVVSLRDALREFERAEREERSAALDFEPLSLPPESTSSPYFGFTYTVLLPLLLFLPAFIAGSVTVDSITEEYDRGTLELLRVAPISLAGIVDGKLAAAAGLVPLQAGLWMLLLRLNGTPVANLPALLLLSAAVGLLVASLGAVVALTAPDRQVAQLVYSVGVLGLFGGATLLPVGPSNAAARLAVGSATPAVFAVVAVAVVVAVGGYGAARVVTGRTAGRMA
ncbi:ABC transporter permease [Halobium salinum]|uniref:ABC transporter permease n=1 Tax=Halobium salinum TaxID=1364940 RepID=A0ABD5P6B3_9EURY|nr:ABC transporter permease [Halobium salinum]